MGNYSYLDQQEGCIIELTKFKKLCEERGIESYNDLLDNTLTFNNLGECINGWKIQGYWYEDFCKMLKTASECMQLTEEETDNYLEMTEEQGFKFYIYFYLKDNKPIVKVNYVPMHFYSFEIDENGNQENYKEV